MMNDLHDSHKQLSDSARLKLEQVARNSGFSLEAVLVLYAGLRKSGGTMAQFNHAELGGMGQWSSGMLMIGDMSNSQLKQRVEKACSEVAQLIRADSHSSEAPTLAGTDEQSRSSSAKSAASENSKWWPDKLGAVASSGSQNDSHYAYFPSTRRLAIKCDGAVTVYDTGDHEIFGVSQRQGDSKYLAFESQNGVVKVADLKVIA